jgi:hypothetical protein
VFTQGQALGPRSPEISQVVFEESEMTTEIPEIVKLWKIGGGSGKVSAINHYTDNHGHNLFCTKNSKYLSWKKMPLGINLDFISDAAVKKVHFKLPDGKERPILSGEPVAFGIGGGEAFLQYADRDVGVNLKWNAKPVFEWKLYSGSAGSPITYGAPLAIANIKVKPSADFLIYFDRPAGMADIGWTTSPQFWNTVANVGIKAGIEAAKKYVLPVG